MINLKVSINKCVLFLGNTFPYLDMECFKLFVSPQFLPEGLRASFSHISVGLGSTVDICQVHPRLHRILKREFEPPRNVGNRFNLDGIPDHLIFFKLNKGGRISHLLAGYTSLGVITILTLILREYKVSLSL